nr:ankyrin repeat-containing protein ITN1-like [Ipomoea trifida]
MKEKCLGKEQGRRLFEKIWSECTSLTDGEFLELIRRKEILHYAAREGNVEFLDMILHNNPDLLWELNQKGQTILHVAVLYRQKKVVHLICNVRGYKDFIVLLEDDDRNNVLHLAATLQGLPDRTTPSQDHDHSLLLKEVEKIVPSSLQYMRNNDDKTAKQLFSKEHMALKIEGEKSIRDTANSCMLVATLIATVAFAAAFTLPGGNEDLTGTPIFIAQTTFTIFTISDVVAMISSMLSIVTWDARCFHRGLLCGVWEGVADNCDRCVCGKRSNLSNIDPITSIHSLLLRNKKEAIGKATNEAIRIGCHAQSYTRKKAAVKAKSIPHMDTPIAVNPTNNLRNAT